MCQRSYFPLASPCLLYLRLSVVDKTTGLSFFSHHKSIQLRAVDEHDLILLNWLV